MPTLDQHIELLRKRLVEKMQELGISETGTPDSLIYHYTTADGLKGILENRYIFATNSNYLNDISELWYGEDRADKFLREQLEIERAPLIIGTQNILDNNDPTLYDELQHDLVYKHGKRFHVIWDAIPAMGRWPQKDNYIASLCQSGDLLSQWRGYANRGGGYALGISVRDSRIRTEEGKFGAIRVLYDPVEQQRVLGTLLSEVLSSVDTYDCSNSNEEFNTAIARHAFLLVGFYKLIGPQLKDAAFAEENEWRFIAQLDAGSVDPLNFRVSNGLLIPFIKLPIVGENISVKRIVCGPTLNPVLARHSVELLARKNGFADLEIDNSRIPLSAS